MESKATKYHLEINGIAEGPMTARELAWKIGAASSDDVILFREDGSPAWVPLEGNEEKVRQLGAQEEPANAPVKLKLKKREGTPPPFPSDAPPPPGATGANVTAPDFDHTIKTPPPLPGAPTPPMPHLSMGGSTTTPPQLAPGAPAHHSPPPPAAPSHPPAKVSTLLVASLVLSFAIVGYIFFLMKQDVAGTATRSSNGTRTREVSGMEFAVLSKGEAEAWKSSVKTKLSAFGAKAKADAEASAGRARPLVEKTDEIALRYAATSRAIYLAVANASLLGISYKPSSLSDIKSLRQLEASLEIAEPYLSPETRTDLEKLRFKWVASAVTKNGFSNLRKALDEEVTDLEAKLTEELSRIRPVADEAADFISRTKYSVSPDTMTTSVGKTDALGLFDLKLTPGEYFLIGRSYRSNEETPTEWSVAFSVKPLAENTIQLNDRNFGHSTAASLWRKADTLDAERDIGTIRTQATRLRMAMAKIEKIRKDIEQRETDLARLSEK